ncbi:3'-5' exonuclease [Fulvivirga maritima]|uniref:3'-5' exonuclease n=1 Tax=Fulvivirga maritima TaxID=2904247 RepID=UPI001F3D8F7B|nr:3'-5' exonuclease [Fulvivirga maritima]UII25669.1 3'-5' exonuclease [Fulvivirga maritima]
MQDYLLFIDTETSGIPQDINTKISHTDLWPFILQVAWCIYTSEGELLKSENHYINEPDIIIEEASQKIHNIDYELLKEKGESRKEVIKILANDLRHYKPLIVGHFVEFDSKMLQVAFNRVGLKNIIKDLPHFCTMRSTGDYVRYTNRDYPSLGILYEGLFKEKLVKMHDASADAEATAKCFFELYRKGEIDEELIENQPLFIKVRQEIRNKYGCGLPVVILLIVGLIMIFS